MFDTEPHNTTITPNKYSEDWQGCWESNPRFVCFKGRCPYPANSHPVKKKPGSDVRNRTLIVTLVQSQPPRPLSRRRNNIFGRARWSRTITPFRALASLDQRGCHYAIARNLLVPATGLEPVLPCGNPLLRRTRLPITPSRYESLSYHTI